MAKRKTEEEKIGYVLDPEFVSKYAREYGFKPEDARRIIESVFELAKTTLIQYHLLHIRGFGVFTIKNRKSCKYKNNWTGKVEERALTRIVSFKPARSLKDSINDQTKNELMRYIKKQRRIYKDLLDQGLIKKPAKF